jgi:Stress responsive A/B Barrel Domain
MLRRFELYGLQPAVAPDAAQRLAEACRLCGHHIPEVLDNAVGTNSSDAPVDVVWEHAFDDAHAYRRYMVHPYHAAVIDRFVLADSPERIVADDVLGAGLVGYRCDGPLYRTDATVRRLVLLQLDRAAPEHDVAELRTTLEETARHHTEVVLSVMAPNSFGACWFDAEHPVGPPPRWTHVWEQAFADRAAFDAYRAGALASAGADQDAWAQWTGGRVRRVAEVWYERRTADATAGAEELRT